MRRESQSRAQQSLRVNEPIIRIRAGGLRAAAGCPSIGPIVIKIPTALSHGAVTQAPDDEEDYALDFSKDIPNDPIDGIADTAWSVAPTGMRISASPAVWSGKSTEYGVSSYPPPVAKSQRHFVALSRRMTFCSEILNSPGL
jgi:hypothetical protein